MREEAASVTSAEFMVLHDGTHPLRRQRDRAAVQPR